MSPLHFAAGRQLYQASSLIYFHVADLSRALETDRARLETLIIRRARIVLAIMSTPTQTGHQSSRAARLITLGTAEYQ